MIHNLIQNLVTLLQDGFADVIPSDQIVAGLISAPAADDLPLIAIYSDKLAINQNVKEPSSSQPRPQEFREEIAVNTTTPAGPYPLAKTPLEKSTICKAIFDQGTIKERQALLVENKDFKIDYQQAKIVFTYDLAKASHIRLTYSFVGVFTMREFQQDFLVDILDDGMEKVEKWASLATGMMLTNHDELIEQYNFTSKTEYSANQFLTYHTLDRIQMLEGVPSRADTCFKLQLKFKVVGQIKLTKAITGGFGLIEKIHSPRRISEQPVDVEIELG